MSFPCQFCSVVCKSKKGRTQHINRNPKCKEQEDHLLGVSGGFCLPAATTNAATTSTANALRRSQRSRKQYIIPTGGGVQVPDVDVGSLDVPEAEYVETEAEDNFAMADNSDLEADDSNMESNADDSEAETSELRDELASSGDESSQNDDESRDSASPNTDILEDFIQYCYQHHLKEDQELAEQEAKSVQLMDLLRKSKAPLSSYQPMLEWHPKEMGHLKQWQSLKDTTECVTRKTMMKSLSKRCNCDALHPKIKKVRLPFSKSVAHIPVRDAKDAVLSLLTDPPNEG